MTAMGIEDAHPLDAVVPAYQGQQQAGAVAHEATIGRQVPTHKGRDIDLLLPHRWAPRPIGPPALSSR